MKILIKNISKNVSGNYGTGMLTLGRNFLIKQQSATDAIKTSSKRVIQKTAEATGDSMGNKIGNRITKISKNSQQNNSEVVTNKNDKEMTKEWYISPEKGKKILDNLR